MVSGQLSDTDLLSFLAKGDEFAFNELYSRHWKLLYTIAVRKTGSKDDAVDLVQDLFVEFWNKRDQLAITYSLESYLKSSLYYKILKHFHHKGFKQKHLEDFRVFSGQQYGEAYTLDPDDLHALEGQYEELMQVINETIGQMPDRMKAIFTMSRSEQYSILEIASQLNISPQTVKNQISAAFTRLRKATDDYRLNAPSLALLIWLTNS